MSERRYAQPEPLTPHSSVNLTEAGGSTPYNESSFFYVGDASSIVLTVSNGNSTDLDVEVYTSPDGEISDSEVYASMNLAANTVKSCPITAGPRYIKVKVINNDSSHSTVVTSKIFRRFRW